SSQALMQDLGGESVFLQCDREEYFSLDEVGTHMLATLNASKTVRQAYETLLAEYDVSPERLEYDLFELITKLFTHGLVEIHSP
ncbi:MAG: PqqD family protein, partial [Cyanobacteria bacterium P01_H01_bin.15]